MQVQRESIPRPKARASGSGAARGRGRGRAKLPGLRGGSKDKRKRTRRVRLPPSTAATRSGNGDAAVATATATSRARRTHSWLIGLVVMAAVCGGWFLVRPLVVGRSAFVANDYTAQASTATRSGLLRVQSKLKITEEQLRALQIEMSDLRAGGAATGGASPRLFDAHDSVRSDAARWVAWSQDFAPLLPWSPTQSGAVLRALIATHHPERLVAEVPDIADIAALRNGAIDTITKTPAHGVGIRTLEKLSDDELALLALWLFLPMLPQLLVCRGDAAALLAVPAPFTNETAYVAAVATLRDAAPGFAHHHPEARPALGSVLAVAERFVTLSDALVAIRGTNATQPAPAAATAKTSLAGQQAVGFVPSSSEPLPLRDQIIAIYERDAPDKIANVDTVLQHFAGREEVLIAKLELKYGVKFDVPATVDGTAAAPTAAAAIVASSPSPLPLRDQIVAMYEKEAPDKIAQIDTVLEHFAGREAVLIAKLEHKYGIKFDVAANSTSLVSAVAPEAAAAAPPAVTSDVAESTSLVSAVAPEAASAAAPAVTSDVAETEHTEHFRRFLRRAALDGTAAFSVPAEVAALTAADIDAQTPSALRDTVITAIAGAIHCDISTLQANDDTDLALLASYFALDPLAQLVAITPSAGLSAHTLSERAVDEELGQHVRAILADVAVQRGAAKTVESALAELEARSLPQLVKFANAASPLRMAHVTAEASAPLAAPAKRTFFDVPCIVADKQCEALMSESARIVDEKVTTVEALQTALCASALAEAERAGTPAAPSGATTFPPEWAPGGISRLGIDASCPAPIGELRKTLECASLEPVVQRSAAAWKTSEAGQALAAMSEAERVSYVNGAILDYARGDALNEVDLFVIDSKQRLWSVGHSLPWQKLDKSQAFTMILAATLRKFQMPQKKPIAFFLSRSTPSYRMVFDDSPWGGAGHSWPKRALPNLRMHTVRARPDLGFGVPSVLASWAASAMHPYPARWIAGVERASGLKPRAAKQDKIVWRGGTTGIAPFNDLDYIPSDDRLKAIIATPRVALLRQVLTAEAKQSAAAAHFDIGFHRVHGVLKDIYTGTKAERSMVKSLEKMVLPPMAMHEQASQYKLGLSIDGKAAPWRLALQLPLDATVLRQDGGPFGEFFDDRLEPMKHYIPLQADLSDLAAQVSRGLFPRTRASSYPGSRGRTLTPPPRATLHTRLRGRWRTKTSRSIFLATRARRRVRFSRSTRWCATPRRCSACSRGCSNSPPTGCPPQRPAQSSSSTRARGQCGRRTTRAGGVRAARRSRHRRQHAARRRARRAAQRREAQSPRTRTVAAHAKAFPTHASASRCAAAVGSVAATATASKAQARGFRR